LDGCHDTRPHEARVRRPLGPAPADLVIRDIIVGDGAEAKPGDNVTVHYAGVEYESGEEFDSSWGRGESIQFPLRGLIQGGRTASRA
jgi:peptidylprolyl isomerase